MSATPVQAKQIPLAGIFGKEQRTLYRAGIVLQVLGAAALAVLYPLESPFYSVGIMVFEAGALLSAVFLPVWISWLRKLLLGSILIGIALQVVGIFIAPPQDAIAVILGGIGFVCLGTAGMAGKEAYCFGYREGWMLMWLYPALVLLIAAGNENTIINALAFTGHFLLILSLAGKKLRQPPRP